MKIYQVRATITDGIRGDQFDRGFDYYLDYNKAVNRKLELKDVWNKNAEYCITAFYIQDIEVIE